MSNTAQIQALQHHPHPTPDILYVTECVDDVEEEEEQETPSPKEVLQISMHALSGKKGKKHNFTVMVQIGSILAIALLDTGSSSTFMSVT
jgi:hypothetical protein